MKLKVLGSGSSENCYILENDTEALIIEAGLPFMEVKKALDFNVKKIVGVIVSHSHGDHAKYVADYEKAGISVFKPYDGKKAAVYDSFIIKRFELVHDVPCYGFYIFHNEAGKLLYATDTEYIKWRFKNVNHILVEANYCSEMIDNANPKYRHVLEGHMSIDTTCEFLKANNNSELRNVVLLHLSKDAATPDMFKELAERVVDCPVYVAEKGLAVDLDLPFS